MFTSPVEFEKFPPSSVTKVLFSYPNIQFKHFDLIEIAKQTLIEDWIKTSKLFRSYFFIMHASDIFRLVLLRKYGGVYIDLDMLVLKDFNDLPNNFACVENTLHNQIGNAFIGFQGELGRQIIDLCLE